MKITWRRRLSPSIDEEQVTTQAGGGQVAHGRRRFWRHLPLLLIEAIGAVASLLLLIIGGLGVWLAAGPIEVDFLTASLTDILNTAADPLHVTIEGTSLRWSPGHPSVELVAHGVHVADSHGARILSLPSLALSLSAEGLFIGHVWPTGLTVISPKLRIDRSENGDIGVSDDLLGGEEDAYKAPSEPWPQLLRALTLPPRANDQFGRLSHVTIEHADLALNDKMTKTLWHVADGSASLARLPSTVDLSLGGQFTVGSAEAQAHATVHLDTQTRNASFDGGFDGLEPSALAQSLPDTLGDIGGVKLKLAGRLGGTFNLGSMQLGTVEAQIEGGAGTVIDPNLADGRLEIQRLELGISYAAANHKLTVEKALLDLGQTSLEVKGSAAPVPEEALLGTPLSEPVTVSASAAIHDLPLDRFAKVWPPAVAPDARAWIVANLSKGTMRSLSAEAGADILPGPDHEITRQSATGTFTVTGATVDYLEGLPKLQGVDADVKFSAQQMNLTITDGHLLGLVAPHGDIVIDALDGPLQHITIDLGIRGLMSDVLEVLNAKRLRYASAIGLEPQAVKGDIDGILHFGFDLKKHLPLDDVDYGAKARLTGTGIGHVALGQDLEKGDFDLLLDREHVRLNGTGEIGGVPATLSWMQRISGRNGPASEVKAKATLDDAARQRFGVDVIPDIVQGPVDVDLLYRSTDAHHSTAALTLGLAPATMQVGFAEWTKAAGEPGQAALTLQLLDDHIKSIDGLHARADGLDLDTNLIIDDGRLAHATINHLTLGQSKVTGTVDHPIDKPWQLKLHGTDVDLIPIRKDLAKPGADDTEGPALEIELSADRMLVGEHRSLAQVALNAEIAQRALISGNLTAIVGDSGKLAFHLDPVGTGGAFTLTTDDFGSFFKLAGITDDLVGGSLDIKGGTIQDGAFRRFSGRAEGKDYRLVHMPFVARLGSVLSLQAMSSLLAGNGIPFTALKADFDFERGRLDIRHGRAYGGAFGINADGWFDTKAGTLALQGTVVPAYTLNSALGGVPVLGNLILGGEGQGLFGANVAIYGSIAEPTISFNPLSALAPGFLRKLFLFDAPGGEASKPSP